MNLTPKQITAIREQRKLIISWSDGVKCELTFSLLRNACPCAECRGGHENMGSDPDPIVFDLPEEDTPKTRIKSIVQTSTYGITIEWEDGHNFGIYNWPYLRALCEGVLIRK